MIIVTYRSAGTIERCLRSIEPGLGSRTAKVVLVDNASDDDTLDVVDAVVPTLRCDVEVIRSDENPGFSAGNNVGLRRAGGDWVLFMNPDAAAWPGAIDELIRTASEQKDIGVLAPALVSPDGSLQATVERTYRLGRVLAGMVRIGGANRATAPPEGGPPIEVPWVWGAVILMPAALARSIGGFDERYFLYAEDMDLCTRVRAQGASVFVAPAIRFDHVGGASAALSGGEPVAAARRVRALGCYLALHQGRWAQRIFAVVAVLLYSVASVWDAIRRRPSAHAAMARAAWTMLAGPAT